MRWPWQPDPDPCPKVKMEPYKDLPEEGRVEQRIEELRPILEWGRRNPKRGMNGNLGWTMPPRFVDDLIRRLDELEQR